MAKKRIFLTEKQIEAIKEQLASNENKQKHVFFTENQVLDIQQKIQKAREETDKNPTEGQKEAGNYKMGRVNVFGFNIAIENPKGSYRKGKDRTGKEWKTLMHNDYGYFTHTLAIDGDAVDVFLGDDLNCKTIFAIDQKINGKFDETKVMLGFKSSEDAKKAYLSNYEKDWKGFWKITEVDIDVFKKWLYDGYQQRKPFFEYADIKKEKLNENVAYSEYDTYLERYDEAAVLQMVISGKNLWTPLIQPSMYQQALNEFTKFGRLEKFPTKYIYQWIGIILKNTAIISSITSISGRVTGYPVEVMINAFFNTPEEFEQYKSGLEHKGTFSTEFGWMEDDKTEVDDEEAICQYFDDNGIFWLMTLPDGSNGWTDFGLRPLEEIVEKYNSSKNYIQNELEKEFTAFSDKNRKSQGIEINLLTSLTQKLKETECNLNSAQQHYKNQMNELNKVNITLTNENKKLKSSLKKNDKAVNDYKEIVNKLNQKIFQLQSSLNHTINRNNPNRLLSNNSA